MELSLAADSSAATNRIGAVLSSTDRLGGLLRLPSTPQFETAPGGRIWIDGVQAIFDPTGATGSLANTLPLRFAQDGGAGVGLDLAGTLDEVEVFSRAIAAFEIEALWDPARAASARSSSSFRLSSPSRSTCPSSAPRTRP